jgi:2-dehydro-3-deoxygluconokinase
VRWFHTGGIYAGLSETTPGVIAAAMTAARRHGTIVSYDLNYRPSLWKAIGGARRAQEVNRRLARDVDVILGNEEDFTACLGLEVEGTDRSLSMLPAEGFKAMIERAAAAYPNFQVIATTLRVVKTATVNDWSAIAWSRSGGFAESVRRPGLEILDRVGGGDSFAAGLIFGLLSDLGLHNAVEYGAAHGALAMTTPGDTSTARKEEVDSLVAGVGARAAR